MKAEIDDRPTSLEIPRVAFLSENLERLMWLVGPYRWTFVVDVLFVYITP